MFSKAQYLSLAAAAFFMSILVLSAMGAERYNKNNEDDKQMMSFSIIGIIFSTFSLIGIGMYVKSGGRQAIMLAENAYA